MKFTVGDRVMITAGPFEGHEAVVVAVPARGDVNDVNDVGDAGDAGDVVEVVEVEAEVFQRMVRITTSPTELQPLSS